MRGIWKPFALNGGLVAALLVYLASADAPLDGEAYVAILLAVGGLTSILQLATTLPVRNYLRGLADGGETLEIERDEIGWFGSRRVVAHGLAGTWVVETTGGKHSKLEVRVPGSRIPRRVGWGARKAARADAEAALARRIAGAAAQVEEAVAQRSRAATVVAAVVVAAIVAILAVRLGPPGGPAGWVVLGAVLAATVAVVAHRGRRST